MMHKAGRNDAVNPGASCDLDYKTQAEVTIGDYLENRSYRYNEKLTFEKWWSHNVQNIGAPGKHYKDTFELVWNASRENL